MSTIKHSFLNEEFKTKKLTKDERESLIETLELLINLTDNYTPGYVPKGIEEEIIALSKRIRDGL